MSWLRQLHTASVTNNTPSFIHTVVPYFTACMCHVSGQAWSQLLSFILWILKHFINCHAVRVDCGRFATFVFSSHGAAMMDQHVKWVRIPLNNVERVHCERLGSSSYCSVHFLSQVYLNVSFLLWGPFMFTLWMELTKEHVNDIIIVFIYTCSGDCWVYFSVRLLRDIL